MRLLLYPEGLVVAEIQAELEISGSTLGRITWRLYAECCTRNKAIKPEKIVQIRR